MKVWVATALYQPERDVELMFTGVGKTKEAAEAKLLQHLQERWEYDMREAEGDYGPLEAWLDNFRDEDGMLPQAYEEEVAE